MSGFAGFTNYTYRRENTELVLKQMADSIVSRGVDIEAYYDDIYTHIGYRCKNVKNIEIKKKAMSMKFGENDYMIVLDGEIYNKNELLKSENMKLETGEDEELILKLYDVYGEHFIEKINGVFAFAIWSQNKQVLYLGRDILGAKPLFYASNGDNFIFASEIKAILQFPEMEACITEYGIANLLLNGVIKLNNKPLFKDIKEVNFGEYIIYKRNELRKEKYKSTLEISHKVPIIKSNLSNISLTKGEIRNIVKIKDSPNRIIDDYMLVKECKIVGEAIFNEGLDYTVKYNNSNNSNAISYEKDKKHLNTIPWNCSFDFRKKLLNNKWNINLDEFYTFQKNKTQEVYNFNCIDKIANRFGYNFIVPQADNIVGDISIRKMLQDIVEYIDSPILDIIDRKKAINLINDLDIDTIIYLIEIDIWLEEYRIKIR